MLANVPAGGVTSARMMIAVATLKGGVGKSTIAVHLAAWLHEQGHRVILADCDSQQSSSEWIREAAPAVTTVRLDNADAILNEIPLLRQDADFVIADGPGCQTETSRALLLRADLAIVPAKASMLEARALAKATEVLRQAQDIRDGVPQAILVLSMVGKHYRLTHDMKAAAAALNLPMANTAMVLRQVYADAPGQGAVVWNLGSRAREAAIEVQQLFREILPTACRKQQLNIVRGKRAASAA
jgi:chromosome partitioning protein